MIEAPAANDNRLEEVAFTAGDLILGSPESNRTKTAETLLNILEGHLRNSKDGAPLYNPARPVSSFWTSSRKMTGTAVQSRCRGSAGIERASFRAH